MKRPGPLAYLAGNNVVFIGLALATIYCAYQAWVGAMSGLVAFVVFVAGCYSHSANEKISAYNTWKAEWAAMSGLPPPMSLSRLLTNPIIRYIVGFLAWALLAGFALAQAKLPGMQVPTMMFWLGTALLVVAGIVRWMRRRRGRTRPFKPVLVSICVAVPRRSDSAAQAFAALPDYCGSLLAPA